MTKAANLFVSETWAVVSPAWSGVFSIGFCLFNTREDADEFARGTDFAVRRIDFRDGKIVDITDEELGE